MSRMLSSEVRTGMYTLKDSLKEPKKFKDLENGSHFMVGQSKEVFAKVGNSHSVSINPPFKDAIFTLGTRIKLVRGAHGSN